MKHVPSSVQESGKRFHEIARRRFVKLGKLWSNVLRGTGPPLFFVQDGLRRCLWHREPNLPMTFLNSAEALQDAAKEFEHKIEKAITETSAPVEPRTLQDFVGRVASLIDEAHGQESKNTIDELASAYLAVKSFPLEGTVYESALEELGRAAQKYDDQVVHETPLRELSPEAVILITKIHRYRFGAVVCCERYMDQQTALRPGDLDDSGRNMLLAYFVAEYIRCCHALKLEIGDRTPVDGWWLPLIGLGQWRAQATWLDVSMPSGQRIKRAMDLFGVIPALDEDLTTGLIDSFLSSLSEELCATVEGKASDPERIRYSFSSLWISDLVAFVKVEPRTSRVPMHVWPPIESPDDIHAPAIAVLGEQVREAFTRLTPLPETEEGVEIRCWTLDDEAYYVIEIALGSRFDTFGLPFNTVLYACPRKYLVEKLPAAVGEYIPVLESNTYTGRACEALRSRLDELFSTVALMEKAKESQHAEAWAAVFHGSANALRAMDVENLSILVSREFPPSTPNIEIHHRGQRDPGLENELIAAVSRVCVGQQCAFGMMALGEITANKGVVPPKYKSSEPIFLPEVIRNCIGLINKIGKEDGSDYYRVALAAEIGEVTIAPDYLGIDVWYGLLLEFIKNAARHGSATDGSVELCVSIRQTTDSVAVSMANDVQISRDDPWITVNGFTFPAKGIKTRKSFLVRLAAVLRTWGSLEAGSHLEGSGTTRRYILECEFMPIQILSEDARATFVSPVS